MKKVINKFDLLEVTKILQVNLMIYIIYKESIFKHFFKQLIDFCFFEEIN